MGQYLHFLQRNRAVLLIAFLVIFYTVGTIGILNPSSTDRFLQLSFLNLLLSTLVVLLARKTRFQHFLLFLGLCFITGMSVEWIGTKTGLLFGNYGYGENLGPKLYGVPLVIGLNWGILIATSASLTNRLPLGIFAKVIVASFLMTALDYLMEPVAIKSDYWSWIGEIPLYNYICWFAVSLPLHAIYFRTKLVESNKVYDALFLILSLFFILLNTF